MRKLSAALLLSCLSTSVYADTNLISLGATKVSADGMSVNGFGGSWALFDDANNNVGLITTASYAKENVIQSSVTLSAFDMNFGPIFKVPSVEWLRFYPLVGFTYVNMEACYSSIWSSECASDNDTFFNYGAGIQLAFPNTPIFADFNIKKVSGDADATIMYLGAGFQF